MWYLTTMRDVPSLSHVTPVKHDPPPNMQIISSHQKFLLADSHLFQPHVGSLDPAVY